MSGMKSSLVYGTFSDKGLESACSQKRSGRTSSVHGLAVGEGISSSQTNRSSQGPVHIGRPDPALDLLASAIFPTSRLSCSLLLATSLTSNPTRPSPSSASNSSSSWAKLPRRTESSPECLYRAGNTKRINAFPMRSLNDAVRSTKDPEIEWRGRYCSYRSLYLRTAGTTR